jgi:hypothetical protein
MRSSWFTYVTAASVALIACKSPDATPPQPEPTAEARGAPSGASSPRGAAQPGATTQHTTVRPFAPGIARTVRIYVAGESIERRNRWVAPPFTASGALNERGGSEARNDDDEYGWAVRTLAG